jgi:hypothetical protein
VACPILLPAFVRPAIETTPNASTRRRLAQFLDVALKLAPGLRESSAVKVVDHLKWNFVIEDEDAEASQVASNAVTST